MGHTSPREAGHHSSSQSTVSLNSRRERVALEFLRHEILPELRRHGRRVHLAPVKSALDQGSLDPLGHLGVPEKLLVLSALETRLAPRTPHRPDPSTVVLLTTSLDLTPQALLDGERHRAVLPPR